MAKRTALEIIAIGRTKACRTFPYFRALILKLVPHEAPEIPTLGVTANAVMMYNPTFIEGLTPAEMEFCILHEVMHLMMSHHSRKGERDPYLWNAAGDLFINPQLREAKIDPPFVDGKKVGIYPDDPEIGLPPNLMAEEYYDRLLAKQQAEQEKQAQEGGSGSEPRGSDSDGAESQGSDSSESSEKGGSSSGSESQSTSMGGNSSARERGSEGSQGGDGESGSYKGGLCAGHCGSVAGHELPDEVTGEGSGERSDASLENTRRVTAEAIRQHVAKRGQGSVPAGLARWADVQLGTPQIPWQSKLARACRRVIAYRPGGLDYRYSRMSRRQSAVGYGRGRPILPSLVAPVPRVAVVLDTSGSMGDEEVGAALTEASGVLKAVGAEVEFVACDARVHVLQKVRRVSELKDLVKGGGGTDFRPAFEALQKRKDPPEVVIFATDGCGPAPAAQPKGMQVIWLLLGPYKDSPCSWGEQIEID